MIRLLMTLVRRLVVTKRNQFLKVALLTVLLVAFSTSGFMYFELAEKPDLGWGDALWWSIVTMTTVGYGDFFPTTIGGRYVIGFPTMMFGISILGYLLSTLATFLIEERSKELKGMSETVLSDHILIIHYPSAARVDAVLTELRHDPKTKDSAVVVIDAFLEELPERFSELGVRFVRGDVSKESTLERASFREARFAIILSQDPNDPGSDNSNLAAALTLEHLHPSIFTVAECIDPERIELLYKAGCDAVVCLTALATNLVVHELLDPGLQKVIGEATNVLSGQNIYFVDVTLSKEATYGDARNVLEERRCAPLGVEHKGGKVVLNPDADTPLGDGDRIVCIAPNRPQALRL
ncbi:potassium channel family protein [Paraliomyxa miuraensis]|uniref:potassium channel family protein n=1 Tax=Paraliomyxa miuraensis TaxID=376150 RepID=UPI0022590278|nr:potassium channel protein [Paraliomyxa miuraensis]MCX4246434.1 ion channel [Paraliomyxa miuraensis]